MPTMKPNGNVNSCPVTKKTWEARAQAKKADCGGESLYHCLPDYEGNKWEKCVPKTLILEGNCPIFTGSDGYFDWKPCNTSELCPNSSYMSNEVYKYPLCFGNNTPSEQTLQVTDDAGLLGSSLWLFLGVAVIILLIIGATILLVVTLRRLRDKKALYLEKHEMEPFLAGKDIVRPVWRAARKQVVQEGLKTLLKHEVKSIVVTGVIGNSVTTTSRLILEEFAKRMNWKHEEYLYNEIPNEVEDKTIIHVYGWFGMWNDDLCSLNRARAACETLGNILEGSQNVKVIIGMKTNVYEKYHSDLEKDYAFLFEDLIHANSTTALPEYTRYFNKVMRLCKNSKCECKRLTTDMLRTGKDRFVGMLLKINIIRNHHECDLIKNYIENGHDILKAMRDHITSLKRNNEPVYGCLAYICLKGQFSVCDTFDEEMVKKIDLKITRASFDDNELIKFVSIKTSNQQNDGENWRCVFWNPFLYICTFHALYEGNKDVILDHCNFNAIFQLVRPVGTELSYIEVPADDKCIDLLQNRINKDTTKDNLLERYKNHPLLENLKATN